MPILDVANFHLEKEKMPPAVLWALTITGRWLRISGKSNLTYL